MNLIKALIFTLMIIKANGVYSQEELFDDKEKKSTLSFGADFTNSTFTLNNPGLNTISNVKKFISSPYITYDHKSGFGITARTSLTEKGVFQWALAPSYSFNNNNVDFNATFTKTFVNNYSNPYINIIQNDISTYFTFVKHWLQPGVSLNIGKGKYTENFTTITPRRQVLYNPLRDTVIKVITQDTARNKINNINITAYLQHYYSWDALIHDEDNLSFAPAIMLNAGNQKITTNTTTVNYLPRVRQKKTITSTSTEKQKFAIQSIGIDLNAQYTIKNIFISPQIYIDQYIAAAGYKPQIYFTFGLGYTW